MTTLFQLAAEYRDAAQSLAALDADEQTVIDTLDGLASPLEEKARNVALVIGNLEALAEAEAKAAGELQDRAKARSARDHARS